ncbi:hypothetical protein MJO28_008513 [Puccinia striiformis f. sp. tritici]|uniref:Uncharacterized protein n=1 Tax=Puccinia striiformis f. sp. tritici TaxID=168172 RepID=A0ACC0ECZ0_9BASI|nr:hypothetical protein MJO28_008513 [Puccinia striiformis f. sp. tritici]KAI7952778.1 hypothetical protein MJO29_008409 [Puccinia striiformis f. sp. tritici]
MKQKSDDPFGWDDAGDKTVPAPVVVDNGFVKPVSDQSGWGDPDTSTPHKPSNQATTASGLGNPDTLTPNNAFTPGGNQSGWGNQDNGSNQSYSSQDREEVLVTGEDSVEGVKRIEEGLVEGVAD